MISSIATQLLKATTVRRFSSSAIRMADFYADSKAPVCRLEIKSHFDALSSKNKHYAHHMSRASFFGTRTVLRQVSYESEDIYDLILSVYKAVNGDIKKLLEAAHVSEEDVNLWLEYSGQFLGNLGNYKSFGDVKFIPRVSQDAFAKIASVSSESKELFEKVKHAIYSTVPQSSTMLGYPDEGHVTAYYSSNLTKKEIDAIQAFTSSKGLRDENSRLWKDADGTYIFKIASANTTSSGEFQDEYELPDGLGKLKLQYGDSSKEFAKITAEIKAAKDYAANDTESKMLDEYARSFGTGSMDAHLKSQALWVKDIGPKVETNIGFIETYRDPSGVRGEWEGLVAMVNEEQTKKFGELVNRAKDFIGQLPWPHSLEKDVFSPPDFTSLEVLTFAGSGIPAGINIPNYDDIRLNVGFKNVSLGNILSAVAPNEKITFVRDDDLSSYNKYRGPAFEVQVGIHELLGHGTGKLLSENSDGSFNYDHENPPVSPLTGKPVSTYYKKGQTWGSVFGAIAGSYEECRAECVAMYLSTDRSLLKIFGHTDEEAEDVLYTAYLQMARAGLIALEFWDPASKKWGQAHMQARYSILKSFLDAGDDFVQFQYTQPDYSDLVIHLDRSKIDTVGKKAVGDYLQKLHVYKTTADYANGSQFYKEMTTVSDDLAKFRPAVLAAKQPRKLFVQANTKEVSGDIELIEYDANYLGLIKSYVDREV